MAYQEKYYYEFMSIDGKLNRVELWQDTATVLTAEEVFASDMPFLVELPELDHKFQTVRGTGCEINLISETNMKFFDGLYHVDKKEFMIKHYIDSNINWLGYLNSELARETYSIDQKYPVQVTGNDGFSLLERIQFLQADGSIYIGVKSLFDILSICINRIGLPFTNINIFLSTTSSLVTPAEGETILHQQFVDCANFINEDGVAETMRKVLESILTPFGAFIIQKDGIIWITDINTLATGETITFLSYLPSGVEWVYMDTWTFTPAVSISSVGYMGTDTEIERSGGKNKQVVSYSPYPIKSYLPKSLTETTEFTTLDLSWSKRPLLTAYNLNYKTMLMNPYWDADEFELVRYWFEIISPYANYAALPGPSAAKTNITYITDDNTYHYRWTGAVYILVDSALVFGSDQSVHFVVRATNVNALRAACKVNPYLVLPAGEYSDGQIVQGAMIQIKAKIQIIKWVNAITLFQGIMTNLIITMKIKIGDYYYNGVTWTTTDSFYYPRISKKDNKLMGTAWNIYSYPNYFEPEYILLGNNGVDGLFIPIDQDISGTLEIEWWTDFFQDGGVTNYQMWHDPRINEMWVSDVSVNVVQSDTADIPDSDKEYIGYLDPLFKEEADKINLLCGTMTSITDRGKILYLDTVYKALFEWTRNSQSFCIEKLLLNSLSSNYQVGYLTLNNMKLENKFDLLTVLTDSYTDSSVFMVKALKQNFRDNLNECTLVEIKGDELTIVE
jgi:hypothetical protein